MKTYQVEMLECGHPGPIRSPVRSQEAPAVLALRLRRRAGRHQPGMNTTSRRDREALDSHITGGWQGDEKFHYLYSDEQEDDDMNDSTPWAIDAEGRIFHEGRYVALIERTPDSDPPFADSTRVTFRIVAVDVDGPDVRMRWHDRPFESGVSGTSARVRLSQDEWQEINDATQDASL